MKNKKRISPLFVKLLLSIIVLSFFSKVAIAQKNSLKGVVLDTTEKKKLHYAIVALIDLKDSTLYQSQRTDEDGNFEINKINPGKYRLLVSYPRMADYLEEMVITDTTKKNLGKLPMIMEAVLLQEVIVRYVPPIRMKGDTLEYAADSFIVKPGANVQELLKRLPGIQVDRNGKITAQGKEVKKILVDGDEFFSDDPGLVTQYMLANSVDKVQVFDKKSDVAEFTGIDDGKRTKTINLKLKDNKKNGYFGKISAAGSDKYYNSEAMGALFHGGEKIALFGMASKTGQTSQSSYELTKYVSQDYEIINDGTGRLFMQNNTNGYDNDYYGQGIPSVVSGGAHYSNKWKKDREKLFTNYRIKNVETTGWDSSNSSSALPGGKFFYNKNNNVYNSSNFSQKASGSFALPVDSFSVVKISMNGKRYNGQDHNSGNGQSINELGFFVNKSQQQVNKFNDGENFSANISYNRQFLKKGRTLSFSLQDDDSRNNNNIYNYSANTYFEPSSGVFKNADTLNQLQTQIGTLKSVAAQVRYSDRFSEHFSAAIEYSWKRADAGNIFSTFNKNNEKYENKVDSLSNDYHFVSNTHATGATFAYNQKKIQVSAGGKVFFTGFQQVNNTVNQLTKRKFINWAPTADISIQPSNNQYERIGLSYQGHTDQPGVEQLQPLRQSRNPLYVQIGNADLVPSFTHNLSLNYSSYNIAKSSSFYLYFSGNYTLNSITNKIVIDSNNRSVSQYINLDGIPDFNGSFSYSWEYKKIHLRPYIRTSIGHYGNYSLVNGLKNKNESLNVNTTIGFNYALENKISINYSGTGSYNIGKSTVNSTVSRTWSHNHSLGGTYYLPLKMELSSNCNFNFQPKNASFNTSINTIQWDASLVKKVLKNDRGLIKFSINDILNNNTGLNRGAYGGGNTYESNRLVIRRYWLLGFTWNFLKNGK